MKQRSHPTQIVFAVRCPEPGPTPPTRRKRRGPGRPELEFSDNSLRATYTLEVPPPVPGANPNASVRQALERSFRQYFDEFVAVPDAPRFPEVRVDLESVRKATGWSTTRTSELIRTWVEAETVARGASRGIAPAFLPDSPEDRDAVSGQDPHDVALGRAVGSARNWTTRAGNQLPPQLFAQEIEESLAGLPVEVTLHGDSDLARMGAGALRAVGGGSAHKPLLARLEYSPPSDTLHPTSAHVALVGAGMTFDSGGLHLRPAQAQMVTMKGKAGAALVAGVMRWAAVARLPLRITAHLPLLESLPSGSAARPGDIVPLVDGRTMELTTSSGSSPAILADAALLALEEKPDYLVTLSSLMDEQILALGYGVGALHGDPTPRAEIHQASLAAGEPLWPLPVSPSLARSLAGSAQADLKGTPTSETALQGYASVLDSLLRDRGDHTRWAHLDLTGPSFNPAVPDNPLPERGTGFGALALAGWLETLAERQWLVADR